MASIQVGKMIQSRLLLAIALILGAGFATGGDGPKAESWNEKLLRERKVNPEGKSLIAFFRKHTRDVDVSHVPRLIALLADPDKADEAAKDLTAVGFKAVPALRKALAHTDPQVGKRAKNCMDRIYAGPRLTTWCAAIQVLVERNPPGAIEALLRFVPCAPSQDLLEDIYFAVYALAKKAERLDPALFAALKDPLPARRALAGLIVARLGAEKERKAVRPLLEDADPEVRLRAAQGFLGAKDPVSIPTLINLLSTAPAFTAWQAEELLHWAAGKQAPEVYVGAGTPLGRKTCQKAWKEWWEENENKVRLNQDGPTPMLLLKFFNPSPRVGKSSISLCGRDLNTRWDLIGLNPYVHHLEFIAPDRVLVGESKGEIGHLSERNLDGKIVWQYQVPNLNTGFSFRLPDGNTFISRQNQVELVRPDGTRIFRKNCDLQIQNILIKNNNYGISPVKDGRILILDHEKKPNQKERTVSILEIDLGLPSNQKSVPPLKKKAPQALLKAQGPRAVYSEALKTTRTIPITDSVFLGGIQALRNGNFLVASADRSLYEINHQGKIVWRYQLPGSVRGRVSRLPNGNTLFFSAEVSIKGVLTRLVEIDKRGGMVWERPVKEEDTGFRYAFPLVALGFGGH